MTAPHEKLNRGTLTGADRAAAHLPALTRAYGRSLRAAGRRAAARFRQIETVTAAGRIEGCVCLYRNFVFRDGSPNPEGRYYIEGCPVHTRGSLTAAANPKEPPGWVIPPTGQLIDQAELAADTERKTAKLHRVMLDASGTAAASAVGVKFDLAAPTSRATLDRFAKRIQTGIYSAIAPQVTEAIRAGYASGASVAQVSRAILAATDAISKPRADMLARSDLNGIANAGSLLAASISGAAATKTWLTAGDEKVREWHADADGQTVAIDQPFDVDGESLDYPGDPAGSEENVLNCFPAGTLVRAATFAGGFRRWYIGDLVTVETESEHSLSGTPNHPVLTTSGWKPLGLIEHGDYLICCTLGQEKASIDPNVEDTPTRIEKVFGALAKMKRSGRVTRVNVDFHGDRPIGEVDVVWADGLLRLADDSAFGQPPAEHLLAASDVREVGLLPSCAPSKVFGTALLTADGIVGSGAQTGAPLRARARHPGEHTSRAIARLNTELEQASADCGTTDLVQLGERLLGLAREITVSQVIKRKIEPFTGHVYNLQVGESQVYSANGVLVHNCRCVVTYGNPLTASARIDRRGSFEDWIDHQWEGDPGGIRTPITARAKEVMPVTPHVDPNTGLPYGQTGIVRRAAEPTVTSGNPEPRLDSEPLAAASRTGVLYLARHGLTEYDSDDHASDTIRGWADDPLNDAGIAEAQRLAENLKGLGITSVWTSDLSRASATADEIEQEIDGLVITNETLRPWNLGELQGRTSDDARDEIAGYCDHPDQPVPGGESFNDFCSRFLPAVAAAMATARAGGSPLLVTHSHNLKLARAWVEGGRQPVTGDQFCEPSPGPASVLAFTPVGDSWTVDEILCDGSPLEETGSVPARVHYRPAESAAERCVSCKFYDRIVGFDSGHCSMFDAVVLADYVCDEFVARAAETAITSGGNMSQIEVEKLTTAERTALRALLDAPLTPEQSRLAAARDALAARGVAHVYDDEEVTAVLAILESLAVEKQTHQYQPGGIGGMCQLCGLPLDAHPGPALLAASTPGTPWQATLCVADEPTVDSGIKRLLLQAGGSWRPLPLPLALLDDSPHADVSTRAPICGRIDQIWWAGNVCQASGVFFDGSDDEKVAEAGSKAAALVGEMRRLGISVDLVDVEAGLMVWDGGGVADLDSANDPTARQDMDDVNPNAPGGPATEADYLEDDPDEVEYIMAFQTWCIAGATICPVQALTDATISLVASASSGVGEWRTVAEFETPAEEPLTAAAAGLVPLEPPGEWFADPQLAGPTPLTVTDEGRVFGHLAAWDTCHTGRPGCVKPPRSPSGYMNFHLGEIVTAEGDRVAVGTLTFDAPHASQPMSASQVVRHYDDTATSGAHVRAGEDAYGIWLAGALNPRISAEEARTLMAAPPSGDWRQVQRGQGIDLVGAHAVNQPGFIVQRRGLSLAASADCEPCEESLARELAVLAASADGVTGLAALVEA